MLHAASALTFDRLLPLEAGIDCLEGAHCSTLKALKHTPHQLVHHHHHQVSLRSTKPLALLPVCDSMKMAVASVGEVDGCCYAEGSSSGGGGGDGDGDGAAFDFTGDCCSSELRRQPANKQSIVASAAAAAGSAVLHDRGCV